MAEIKEEKDVDHSALESKEEEKTIDSTRISSEKVQIKNPEPIVDEQLSSLEPKEESSVEDIPATTDPCERAEDKSSNFFPSESEQSETKLRSVSMEELDEKDWKIIERDEGDQIYTVHALAPVSLMKQDGETASGQKEEILAEDVKPTEAETVNRSSCANSEHDHEPSAGEDSNEPSIDPTQGNVEDLEASYRLEASIIDGLKNEEVREEQRKEKVTEEGREEESWF